MIVVNEGERTGYRLQDVTTGVSVGFIRQRNGELRRRVDYAPALSVCHTISPCPGHWQDWHSHERASETYLVIQGQLCLTWIATNGKLQRLLLGPGQMHVFAPGVVHNVYVFEHTETLTTRQGSDSTDRSLMPELERLTANLTEEKILGLLDPST